MASPTKLTKCLTFQHYDYLVMKAWYLDIMLHADSALQSQHNWQSWRFQRLLRARVATILCWRSSSVKMGKELVCRSF